ncbi:MAG TPA: hypothetical protein VGR57_14830, partial [Ktedonobacterales bacterium]|nr:hypothetical protein [Ktedonobacterales bacterium]
AGAAHAVDGWRSGCGAALARGLRRNAVYDVPDLRDHCDGDDMDQEPSHLLAALRQGGAAADAAREMLRAAASAGAAAALRARVTDALIAALLPSDHAVVAWLLGEEIATLARQGHGATDALYLLVAACARFGNADDALLLWRAYTATPETRATVDVEHLARAGVERVRATLGALAAAGPQRTEAAAALAWFEQGVASGALDDLAGYFAWSDEQYGLVAGAPV